MSFRYDIRVTGYGQVERRRFPGNNGRVNGARSGLLPINMHL